MADKETITLSELVEQGRITGEDGAPLPEYDRRWIREHGNQYRVAPISVSFVLKDEYDLWPSQQLERVVLDGFYTVNSDNLRVNMGRKSYELRDRPIRGFLPLRHKTTIVEFKEK